MTESLRVRVYKNCIPRAHCITCRQLNRSEHVFQAASLAWVSTAVFTAYITWERGAPECSRFQALPEISELLTSWFLRSLSLGLNVSAPRSLLPKSSGLPRRSHTIPTQRTKAKMAKIRKGTHTEREEGRWEKRVEKDSHFLATFSKCHYSLFDKGRDSCCLATPHSPPRDSAKTYLTNKLNHKQMPPSHTLAHSHTPFSLCLCFLSSSLIKYPDKSNTGEDMVICAVSAVKKQK